MSSLEEVLRFKGFIFDLDGVVYRGDAPIPGAAQAIRSLERAGKRCVFVTNHTRYTRADFIDRLHRFGIPIEAEQILTANDAIVSYLKARPGARRGRVNLIGSGGILEELERAGIEMTADRPDHVVVAWDSRVDYEKLYLAAKHVREGATFIVAGPDRCIPSERGLELGFGAIGAAIEYATRVPPVFVGKPYPTLINLAVERMETQLSDCVIVGDTAETDLRAKHLCKLGFAVLVLSGNTLEGDVTSLPEDMRPNLVLNSIADLAAS